MKRESEKTENSKASTWRGVGHTLARLWRSTLWVLRAVRWVLESIAWVFVVVMHLIFFPLVIARLIVGPRAAEADDLREATAPYYQHFN